MYISDVTDTGDGLEFTLSIDLSEPSEPYSSLDFNLVSSNHTHLAITDHSPAGDRSDLAIAFPAGHGNAYHQGRIDQTNGAISYLIGIFSSAGGNAITEQTNICEIRMHYTGQEAQELSIRDLKLIYKTPDGFIDSTPIETVAALTVTPTIYTENQEKETTLSRWHIAGVIIALIAMAALAVLTMKKRKTTPTGDF